MDDRLLYLIVVSATLAGNQRDDGGNIIHRDHRIHVHTNKGIIHAIAKASDWLGDGWCDKETKRAELVGDCIVTD